MVVPTPHAESDHPTRPIGRDEMNLAEFPIALLADRVPKGQKTLYFEDKHGRLTITGSDAYGLPTAIDTDVIVALIYLTKLRNDFRDAKVNFSRYELIKTIGWKDEGKSYRRLEQSFNRWGGVWLVYEKCWWNNHLKCYTDAKMHIIDSVEIVDHDTRRKSHLSGQGGLPLSYFTWNRTFIESCQADNLRQLDLDTYFSLNSSISKRLYRFLGKRFYLQGDWTFDLNEVAFDRLGLSRNYTNAYKIKEKLHPAIDELESIGFLRPLSHECRYSRISRGRWTIRLARQSPALVTTPSLVQPTVEPEPPPLVAELTKRGVTKARAAELAWKHPADIIAAKVEVFDWLTEKQDQRVAKSPAGYLVKSITDDYAEPKGFVSQAERQRRQEIQQVKEREAVEARRRKREQEARDRAERQAIAAYWDALTPEQQATLDADARAEADPEMRKLTEGPMKRFGLKAIRDPYILKRLRSQEERPSAEP